MDPSATAIDAEELFHLALAAIGEGDHEGAIDKLKRTLALAPDDGWLYFLLGAEYAEIGMYDRAIAKMNEALARDPQLHPARFQLGLLQLRAGRIDEAKLVWADLDKLGPKNSMVLYKDALLHFDLDKADDGIRLLNEALAAETSNESLRKQIEKSLQRAKERFPGIATAAQAKSTGPAKSPASELLSRYDEASDEDKSGPRRH